MSSSKKPEVATEIVLQLLSDLKIFNWSLSGSFDTIKNLSKAKIKYSDGTKLNLGTPVTYSNAGDPPQSSVPVGSTANNQPISIKVKGSDCKDSYFSVFMVDPDAENAFRRRREVPTRRKPICADRQPGRECRRPPPTTWRIAPTRWIAL